MFPPALFAFYFFLLFLFALNPNFNGSDHKSPFFSVKGEKLMGKNVKFLKAIVGYVRFTITFSN